MGNSLQVSQQAGENPQGDKSETQPDLIAACAVHRLVESGPDHFTLATFQHSTTLKRSI